MTLFRELTAVTAALLALSPLLASPVTAEEKITLVPPSLEVLPIKRTSQFARSSTDAAGDTSPKAAQDLSHRDELLSQIGNDLEALGSEIAIDELNHLARYALEVERPDLFRQVMVSQVDEHWGALSDPRTALNMIAWLPDTADNLMPRIIAARLAISGDELPSLEAERLWRDLRARVERVGDPALLMALCDAMIRSGSPDLLVETVTRFHTTDRRRLETIVSLLREHGRSAPPETVEMLYQALENLGGLDEGGAHDAPGISLALWTINHPTEAFKVLSREPDPLIRLRTRFELLAQLPDVSHTEPVSPEEDPGNDPETMTPSGP